MGNIYVMCVGFLNFIYFLSNSQTKHWNTHFAKWFKQHKHILNFLLFSILCKSVGLSSRQTIDTHPWISGVTLTIPTNIEQSNNKPVTHQIASQQKFDNPQTLAPMIKNDSTVTTYTMLLDTSILLVINISFVHLHQVKLPACTCTFHLLFSFRSRFLYSCYMDAL